MPEGRRRGAASSGVSRFFGKPERKARRRTFATAELSTEEVEAIAASRMHPRHNALDALLDRDEGDPTRG